MVEDSRMIGVGKYGASIATGRLGRIALLALAGAIGAASEADAALYYWSGYYPGYYLPAPTFRQRLPRVRRHQAKRIETPEKESTKPQGPLLIAISIERQKLKIYDAKGFFAETPISTGMKGHSTPMGVFSIIQKHKFHHSNIYSGAPMPYMQRITWSGVAMHAGVLPGYPASHGCIRMPMSFAVKMWGWTKMGARVVVTPGEMTPVGFSHPLLPVQKTTPVASAGPRREMSSGTKSDRAAIADAIIKPTIAEAAPAIRREQAHTADASDALPRSGMSATMSDATPSASRVIAKTDEASSVEVKSEAAEGWEKTDEIASPAKKPIELNLAETIPTDVKAAEASASIKTDS